MAKKSNKKIFYASLVLLIIVIVGVFFYIQKTSNPALSDCIKEWGAKNLKPTEYASGSIFVEFIPTVTEQEAKRLIQKNGLSILRSYLAEEDTFAVYIEVPIGSEFRWVCKFKTNAIVSEASVIFQ